MTDGGYRSGARAVCDACLFFPGNVERITIHRAGDGLALLFGKAGRRRRQPVTLHVNLTRLICHTGRIAFSIFLIMKKFRLALAVACLACVATAWGQGRAALSVVQVKQQIIAESIAAYPGRCPCPYHAAKNGSACGARSAWSRQGGYAPICYEREVSSEMVVKWRQAQGAAGA